MRAPRPEACWHPHLLRSSRRKGRSPSSRMPQPPSASSIGSVRTPSRVLAPRAIPPWITATVNADRATPHPYTGRRRRSRQIRRAPISPGSNSASPSSVLDRADDRVSDRRRRRDDATTNPRRTGSRSGLPRHGSHKAPLQCIALTGAASACRNSLRAPHHDAALAPSTRGNSSVGGSHENRWRQLPGQGWQNRPRTCSGNLFPARAPITVPASTVAMLVIVPIAGTFDDSAPRLLPLRSEPGSPRRLRRDKHVSARVTPISAMARTAKATESTSHCRTAPLRTAGR